MQKTVIVVLSIVVGLLVLAISLAVAQEPACIPPNLSCPQCIVTCEAPTFPTFPECPACTPTLTCADNMVSVPGLWEVTTNKRLCGEIILGPSWVIINGETLMLNKVKRMVKVENC